MNTELREALEKVLSINSKKGNNAYAITYTRTALEFPDLSIEAMKIQVRYVLTNLQFWRGQEARDTKKVLNDFVNGRIND